MVKVSELKNINGEVTEKIIDLLIEKILERNYRKKDIVVWYLCQKNNYEYFNYYDIDLWWEKYDMDHYIECFIPWELRPIYVKKMYEAIGEDMDKAEYEESLLKQKSEFLYDILKAEYYDKNDTSLFEKAQKYFESFGYIIEVSSWPSLKKEFEESLINDEQIPDEINDNRDIIDNSKTEENLNSLYQNIPDDKEKYDDNKEELNKLFPIKDDRLTDEEIFDKYYEEAIDDIKFKVYNDEESNYYMMDDIRELYGRLSVHSVEMLYHKLYSIIESMCKYDSNYDYNDIKKLAKKYDSLDEEVVYDEGFKLLKEDAVKYILIIREMNNTKNAAYLRFMFNVIYDDKNFVDNNEDVHKLIHRASTSNNLEFRLNYGLDVNGKNHYNDPIVFKMYSTRFSTELDILRDYNYNFDLEDHNGNNIIMHIVKKHTLDFCHDFIEEIVKTNFDIYHKNKNGETLLDLFLKNSSKNNKELIPIFEKLYDIRINDVDVEFSNKLKEVEEKIKVYKKK